MYILCEQEANYYADKK